jgi:hypothetical protein
VSRYIDADFKEEMRKGVKEGIAEIGRSYRKWLAKRDDLELYLSLIPDRLHEIPNARIWGYKSPVFNVYVSFQFSYGSIKLMQEIMEEAGWTTNDEIETAPDVYMYYRHPELPNLIQNKIIINIETPKQIYTEDGEVCIVVPIEWETKLEPKTYDRICPKDHPELFRDGVYIGDELFPAMPKELEGIKVTR